MRASLVIVVACRQWGYKMGKIADLQYIGAPVEDPVRTAAFIGGMILTKRQKAALLKDYLGEKRVSIDAAIRGAADAYVEAL